MILLFTVPLALLLIANPDSGSHKQKPDYQESTHLNAVYYSIYGNTVAKEIGSQKVGLRERILEFVQDLFSQERKFWSETCYLTQPCEILDLSRLALFLSADGATPFRALFYWLNARGNQVFQRRLLSTGVLNLFSFYTVCNGISDRVNATLLDRNDMFFLHSINSNFVRNENELNTNLLRILTFNIWNMNSREKTAAGYIRRLELVIEEIRKSRPDIIGLQEVRFDSRQVGPLSPSQIEQLSASLPGYNYVFQPASLDASGDVSTQIVEEGLAILSRYPIKNWSHVILPSNASLDVHQRICLHAEIDTPMEPGLHLFVTHLSLNRELRRLSVAAILRFMDSFAGRKVLLGDMNSEPDSEEMLLVGESGLRDAWLMFYPEPEIRPERGKGAGEERFYGLTFDATDRYLRKRIDFVYLDQSLVEIASGIELFGLGKGGEISDHLGVILSLLSSQERVGTDKRSREDL